MLSVSSKHRSSTTAAVALVEPSAGHSKRSHSKKRKRSQQQAFVGRRLAIPLVTFLFLFIWVLGIVALCQHRRNLQLTTTDTARISGQTRPFSFLRRDKHQPLLWNNNNNGLVHVIQTRFMQYQGHLLQLGRARLKLFEAITLPSVVHQTNNNDDTISFIWIIRTDPNLALELRARLIQLVEPYDFIVLVGSNENPEGFRGLDCIADMMPLPSANAAAAATTTATISNHNPIWSGHLETVHSYHQAAQSHAVLETRLDADDGLLLHFVQLVQADAARRFHRDNNNNNNNNNENNPSSNGDWMVWCAKNHMEWQYASPWKTNTDENVDTEDQGGLVGLKSNFCVTAGLTFAYGVGSSPTQIPSHKHQQLHDTMPACDTAAANNQMIHKTRCLARIEPAGNLPAVIRARTPTSAGMEHVLTGLENFEGNKLYLEKVKGSGWKDSQHDLFHELPKLFGVQPFELRIARAHIKKHLPEILSDAIAGQCTRGHSCKEESKRLLQQLLEETTTK
jgi:hypothetical protein